MRGWQGTASRARGQMLHLPMPSSSLDDIESALLKGGLPEALKLLNGRVQHRFTAIYRLEDMALHNVCLVDKTADDFDTSVLQKLPLGDSFCQFVIRDGFFKTSHTTGLDMLNGHPYQGVLESYVGLPLMKNSGEMFGTLCHFDFAEKVISDDEFLYLQKVARLLPRFL